MSLKKYLNNAWQEITELKKNLNNAWQDCEFGRIFKDNTWVDVWTKGLKATKTVVDTNSGQNHTHSISDDRKSLTFKVTGTGVAQVSQLVFGISKSNGFGTRIKIKYTLKQTVSITQGASLGFMNGSFGRLSSSSGVFWQRSSISNEKTYEGTVTLSSNQTTLYLNIDANYNYSIEGTIKNIYINDELVTFE